MDKGFSGGEWEKAHQKVWQFNKNRIDGEASFIQKEPLFLACLWNRINHKN